MNMMQKTGLGCDVCWAFAGWGCVPADPPESLNYTYLGTGKGGPVKLYRCNACGTHWAETLHNLEPLEERRARQYFPDLFPPGAG